MGKQMEKIEARMNDIMVEVTFLEGYTELICKKGDSALARNDNDTLKEVMGKQLEIMFRLDELNQELDNLKAAYATAMIADLMDKLGEGS